MTALLSERIRDWNTAAETPQQWADEVLALEARLAAAEKALRERPVAHDCCWSECERGE